MRVCASGVISWGADEHAADVLRDLLDLLNRAFFGDAL
jgi:hypothetical protein